jgi:hypothetical protein
MIRGSVSRPGAKLTRSGKSGWPLLSNDAIADQTTSAPSLATVGPVLAAQAAGIVWMVSARSPIPGDSLGADEADGGLLAVGAPGRVWNDGAGVAGAGVSGGKIAETAASSAERSRPGCHIPGTRGRRAAAGGSRAVGYASGYQITM